jgi:hypothetical protein
VSIARLLAGCLEDAPRREQWMRLFLEQAPVLSAISVELWQRRREIARRMGLASPAEIESALQPAAAPLRCRRRGRLPPLSPAARRRTRRPSSRAACRTRCGSVFASWGQFARGADRHGDRARRGRQLARAALAAAARRLLPPRGSAALARSAAGPVAECARGCQLLSRAGRARRSLARSARSARPALRGGARSLWRQAARGGRAVHALAAETRSS